MDPAEVRDLVQFSLEAKLGIQIHTARSEAEGIGLLLTDSGIDLIIVDTASVSEQFCKFAEDKAPHVSFIEIVGTDSKLSKELKIIEQVPKNKTLERLPVVLGTWVEAQVEENKKTKNSFESEIEKEYCRIQTGLLLDSSPLKSDIYVRLSSQKYLKLFLKGDSFDRKDSEKYLKQKKIEYLYLRTNDTAEFVDKFAQKLETLLKDGNLTSETATVAAVGAVETIREIAIQIGVTPAVQKVFQAGVALVMKSVSRDVNLSSILDQMMNNQKQYIAAHSVATAQIACALGQKLDWSSETTFQKLTMAAMLHDVTVTNHELCRMRGTKELNENKGRFSPEEILSFQNHPAKASELIKAFSDVHADVDTIISQHHELPDGMGFPKGLSGGRISPLAALFIVAHDIADTLIEQKGILDLKAFVELRKEVYPSGNFKKSLLALLKADIRFG